MPILRSSWSEALGILEHRQIRDSGTMHVCADVELNAWECMEAYGQWRGERYCRTFMEDLAECTSHTKQVRRVDLMRRERLKQFLDGERKLGSYYDKIPPKDSYQPGPFTG